MPLSSLLLISVNGHHLFWLIMGSAAPNSDNLDYGKLTGAHLLEMRALVLEDGPAIDKWPQIIDFIVPLGADARRIKRFFQGTDADFPEGVLQSLQKWHACGAGRADLLKVLGDLKLNLLKDAILGQVIQPLQAEQVKANPKANSNRTEQPIRPVPQTLLQLPSINTPNGPGYPVQGFNQGRIESIINSVVLIGKTWTLDLQTVGHPAGQPACCNKPADCLASFNTWLVTLARDIDLSQIITWIRYPSSPYSVFNTVGQWAVLAKIAENAKADELSGSVAKADWQWSCVEAVLNHALEKGINYCSLIRGWDSGSQTGAAQGDQILKLLADSNLAVNNEIKTRIFRLIHDEAVKGESGLYGIPERLLTNTNVQHADRTHKIFVREKLDKVSVKFYSKEPVTAQAPATRILRFEDFMAPPGTGGGDLSNSANWSILLSQANALVNMIQGKSSGVDEFAGVAADVLSKASEEAARRDAKRRNLEYLEDPDMD